MEDRLILNKLDFLTKQVGYILEHIEDTTLTEDDLLSLKNSEIDLKKGKTKRLE